MRNLRPCRQCPKGFTGDEALQRHLLTSHAPVKTVAPCTWHVPDRVRDGYSLCGRTDAHTHPVQKVPKRVVALLEQDQAFVREMAGNWDPPRKLEGLGARRDTGATRDSFADAIKAVYDKRDYMAAWDYATALFSPQQEKNDLAAMALLVTAPNIYTRVPEFNGSLKLSEMLLRDHVVEAAGCCPAFSGCMLDDKMERASEDLNDLCARLLYGTNADGERAFLYPRPFRYPCHHKVKDYGRGVRYVEMARIPFWSDKPASGEAGYPLGYGWEAARPLVYPVRLTIWDRPGSPTYDWPLDYDDVDTLAYVDVNPATFVRGAPPLAYPGVA